MKEKYFNRDNITIKAKQIKEQAESFSNKSELEFVREDSLLLVIDMQKFFAKETSHAFIPSFDTIVPNVTGLISAFEAIKRPVIFTKHVNTAENAQMMGKWWKGIITKEDEHSGIIDEFDTTGHMVIEKTQYDSFYNTNLEGLLRDLSVKSLVITGVMTHLCCETTARAAFVRGFGTFFAVDATAAYNEHFHRNTVVNLAHGFAVPVMSGEILEKLNE